MRGTCRRCWRTCRNSSQIGATFSPGQAVMLGEAVITGAGCMDRGHNDEGGRAGFAEFVAARGQALQRTAFLLAGDWALAEDLVQTALARAYPRWSHIQRDDPEAY